MSELHIHGKECIIVGSNSGLWVQHNCNNKLLKIEDDTMIVNLKVKCKRCKKIVTININKNRA